MYKIEVFTTYKNVFIAEYQIKENIHSVDKLKKMIDDSTGALDYKTNVKGKMTDFKQFINEPLFLNILKECEIFFNTFNFKKMYLQDAWGNILEENEEVIEHDHGGCEVSGVLYLTEGGSGTYFSEINKTIEEKIGKIIFFSSNIKHSVIKNKLHKRYTLAFNFVESKEW